MTQQELTHYFEVDAKIKRMASLIDRFELSYFQEKMRDKIISPLLQDGFEQDDLDLFFQVAIHAALANTSINND
jgi:hypothetical protein